MINGDDLNLGRVMIYEILKEEKAQELKELVNQAKEVTKILADAIASGNDNGKSKQFFVTVIEPLIGKLGEYRLYDPSCANYINKLRSARKIAINSFASKSEDYPLDLQLLRLELDDTFNYLNRA